MTRVSPELRRFAGHVVAHETMVNDFPAVKIPAACIAMERLRPHLAALMGGVGFSAFLTRALTLSITAFPWLREITVNADGSFRGFNELEAQVKPGTLIEGCVAVFANLLGLLEALIGEDLTLRLVRDVWPELPPDGLTVKKVIA